MPNSFEFTFISSVANIDATEWSKVINSDYPFIQQGFFLALEESGATSEQTGWKPYHLVIKQDNKLQGFMPLYVKTHSYGEYVFDFQWADAYHQSGINYYPKLVTAIPFTPATGKRIYLDHSINQDRAAKKTVYSNINQEIQQLSIEQKMSSWHILFPTRDESDELINSGAMRREGIQYHWCNHNYHSFDDFLSGCKLKQRKNIKRERRKVKEQGIEIRVVEGNDITSELWQQFYLFYQMTYAKRSGHGGYLNQKFFELVGQYIPDSIVMMIASVDGKIVAASLLFKDSRNLYGRYWGCLQEFDFLHFELCYYQGIEYCIQHQLKKFDAGAQGEHKIQRGFEPTKTYSNHWIAQPEFSNAIQDFVKREGKLIDDNMEILKQKLPFKK